MNASLTLRQQLAAPGMVIAPGAYDGIGARLIEQAGFGAVYMTGAGTSAARGFPDFGLLSMSEMVDNAAVMARSIAVPLIADADTGYGIASLQPGHTLIALTDVTGARHYLIDLRHEAIHVLTEPDPTPGRTPSDRVPARSASIREALSHAGVTGLQRNCRTTP